jgi:hypothetical protein
MACSRFLEVHEVLTYLDCKVYSRYYYYPISANETSFSLTPWNIGPVWCGVAHQGRRITSNTGRHLDGFYFTSISFSRIIKAKSKPPTSTAPYQDILYECECPPNSCQVDCPNTPDGFCCIPHSLTDRLLQVLHN